MTRHRKNSSASWAAWSPATSMASTPMSSRYPSRAPSRTPSRAPSPGPVEPFRFFDLPTELRLRVYEYLLFVPKTVDLGKRVHMHPRSSTERDIDKTLCRSSQLPPPPSTSRPLPCLSPHARRSKPDLLLAAYSTLPYPRSLLPHQKTSDRTSTSPLSRCNYYRRATPRTRLEQPTSLPENHPFPWPQRLHELTHSQNLRRV